MARGAQKVEIDQDRTVVCIMDMPFCPVCLLIRPWNLSPNPPSFWGVIVLTLSHPLSVVENVCSYLISSQRSSLRPTLEDFDRTRSFHISEDQFLRVLTIFQLLSPGDKDAALLIKVQLIN